MSQSAPADVPPHGPHSHVVGTAVRAVSRRQALTLFGFVLFAFMLLAWRTETNASNIRRALHVSETNRYRNCLIGRQAQVNLNATENKLADIERDRQLTVPDLAAARITAYRNAIAPLPDCGPAVR